MLSDKRRKSNRDNLGQSLKDARLEAGYTQRALAEAVGLEYYTMISQMELGYISIPPSLWVPLASVCQMDRTEWVLRCLLEYQPDVYTALFGNKSRMEVTKTIDMLHKGKLDKLIGEKK